jgi:hypothetical protein
MFVELKGEKVPLEEALLHILGEKERKRAQSIMNELYMDYHRFLIRKRAKTSWEKAKATHQFMDHPKTREYERGQADFYKAIRQWQHTGKIKENCVGFMTIYMMLCSYAQVETFFVHVPQHVLSMHYFDRPVFVENTSSYGFDKKEKGIKRPYVIKSAYGFLEYIPGGLRAWDIDAKDLSEMGDAPREYCRVE